MACVRLLEAAAATRTQAGLDSALRKSITLLINQVEFKTNPVYRAVFRNVVEQGAGRQLTEQELDEVIDREEADPRDRIRDGVRDALGKAFGVTTTGWIDSLRSSAERMALAVETIRLLCPESVADQAVRLRNAANDLTFPHEQAEKWEQRDTAYREARIGFLAAARTMLMAPPLLIISGMRRARSVPDTPGGP